MKIKEILIIVTLGILVYAPSLSHMGMVHDDLGIIFETQINSIDDIKTIFSSNIASWHVTDEERAFKDVTSSAFNVHYRPFGMTILGLIHSVVGPNAYIFYLFNIMMHIINALLFFFILCWMLPSFYSLLGAIAFLFQPSFGKWVYILCTNQDIMNLTFILVMIILYKKFLSSGSYLWYIATALVFFVALFNRETVIVFPVCLLIYRMFSSSDKPFSVKNFIKLFKQLYLFALPVFLYAGVRIAIFGLGNSRSVSLMKLSSFKEIVWSVLSALIDILGLTFVTSKDPRVMAIFVVPVLLGLAMLVLNSYKRYKLMLLIICGVINIWPVWLLNHDPRYVYVALPISILCLLVSIYYSKLRCIERYKVYIASFIFLPLTIWGAYDAKCTLLRYAKVSSKAIGALNNLEKIDSKVAFIGLPYKMYASGFTQALKLFDKCDHQAFHFKGIEFAHDMFTDKLCSIKIKKLANGYQFKSLDPSIAYWVSTPEVNEGDVQEFSWGHIIVDQKHGRWKTTALRVVLSDDVLSKLEGGMKLMSWDSRTESFIVI